MPFKVLNTKVLNTKVLNKHKSSKQTHKSYITSKPLHQSMLVADTVEE